MAPTPNGTNIWRWGRWTTHVAQPPPDRDVTGVRFFQFNMCGSVCNEGDVQGVVNAIRDSVLSYRPDILVLNEACLAQADRLWEQLKRKNVTMTGCFGLTTGRSLCPGEDGKRWYGNAVFSMGAGIGAPELIALPNRPDRSEQRSVISMQTDLRGIKAFVSSTHLVPRGSDEEYNCKQITEVARIHNARAGSGNVVVLAGDFNATPQQVAEVILPAGHFQDVDYADNEPTFSTRKIDYVFLNVESFHGLTGDATRSNYSDHRPLRGQAILRVPDRIEV
jgi:endonuclease/exonuclease/phosphatase family metal-dependent hydrolase